MTTKNKITFTVKQSDKPDFDLSVIKPSVKVQQDGQIVYSKSFKDYVTAGAILKAKLDSYIREQKIWDDNRESEYQEIVGRLRQNEKVVKGLVKGTTFSKGREAAIEMRRDRIKLQKLTADKTALEANTVEGQAENARFNYFVATCTVYPDSKKTYFRDVEDYMTREEDPATIPAANNFASLYYGFDPDQEKTLPENQFLLKYKLCDEKLHLTKVVDGVTRLVDTENRLVDEEGRYILKDGSYCDKDGNSVDKEGNPVGVETFDFVEDNIEEKTM